MIELENVGLWMHGRTVLEHGTATLRSATITYLTGAVGSGKSTLVRAIAGIEPYSGSIRFAGADVARVRSDLYVCFDDAPLFPFLSGYENVRLLLGRSLPRTHIASVAPAIADDAMLRMPARALSDAQRTRVHLAAALASGARYLVFDDVLSGVGAPTPAELGAALRHRAPSATVLVTGRDDDAYGRMATPRIDLVGGALISSDRAVHG